jgi:protein TonB
VIALVALLSAIADAPPEIGPSATRTGFGSNASLRSGAPTSEDYPRAALQRGSQGLTRVLIRIRADGTAYGCRIHQSSGDPELDWTACTIVTRRTRFHPALDLSGAPVEQIAILPVRWMLGE